MARIAFSDVLRVGMSTYYGNLDDSEWMHDFMTQDLHDISDATNWREEWNVKCKMLDWTERTFKEKDLEDDYSVNRDTFREEVISRSESEINGSIMMASDHKFQDIKELLAAYWMEFDEWKWYMPQYYNYEHDTLDICYDLVDEDWSLEKYWLTELVQKYIDEVRVESYDWYCSFEPKNIDDVEWNDYCVMWAILQKEWVFNSIKDDLQEMADYQGYEIYQEAVEKQHYYWREDTMPDKWDWYYQDRYKLHYFILEYNDKYLQEVEESEIYPPKND